jgi:hypothetical protein
LSIWLCHDENQKHEIIHEARQNRKGTTQGRKTGLLANPIQARSGAVPGMARRRRSSVNRIEEKIKKYQKCQNPCNSGLVKGGGCCGFSRFSIIFPGIREIREIRGQILNEPGKGATCCRSVAFRVAS